MIRILHVPKTGGTSMWLAVQRSGLPDAYHTNMYLTHQQPEHPTYLQSHELPWTPEDGALYGIVIRDPADWYVSVYNHLAARVPGMPDFPYWYEVGGKNPILKTDERRNRQTAYMRVFCGFISMRVISDMLRRCWFVSTTDNLYSDWYYIQRTLGIDTMLTKERAAGAYDNVERRKTDKRFTLTDDWRDRIYEENKSDRMLYELALHERLSNAVKLDERHGWSG